MATMTSKTSRESSRRVRQRRLDVERLLADRGLLRGPRRILSGRGQPAAEAGIVELRSVLEELGPAFAAFGRYLAQRADLLEATDCLVLEGVAAEASPSPIVGVDARLRQELGRPRREVFPVFEEVPFEIRWLDQSHRARLETGERVVVRIVHPDVERDLEQELEALAVLQGVFAGPGFSGGEHFAQVLADFRRVGAARRDPRPEERRLGNEGRARWSP